MAAIDLLPEEMVPTRRFPLALQDADALSWPRCCRCARSFLKRLGPGLAYAVNKSFVRWYSTDTGRTVQQPGHSHPVGVAGLHRHRGDRATRVLRRRHSRTDPTGTPHPQRRGEWSPPCASEPGPLLRRAEIWDGPTSAYQLLPSTLQEAEASTTKRRVSATLLLLKQIFPFFRPWHSGRRRSGIHQMTNRIR